MSADKHRYSDAYKQGDCFNAPDAPGIVPEYDSGKGLSEHNAQIAEEAKRTLED
jgi:hypothetical protein